MGMPQVKKEKIVFDKALIIQEAHLETVSAGGKVLAYSRLRVKRVDAVAVFIYNTGSESVVLTRQFRYAISDRVSTPILELMAGKIDPGETPEQTALRESLEECGYRIRPEKLIPLASFFASPGYTSEKYHLFFAAVTSPDRVSQGGGLESENESIEVVEMPLAEFRQLVKSGQIVDAKTLLGAVYAEPFIEAASGRM